jgi:hypothetical protein
MVAVGLAFALVPATAGASFHLMKINEVFPGTPAAPDKAFVELKMTADGQNFVSGHEITVYNGAGTLTDTVAMTANLPNGENNRTVLLGDIDVTNRDFAANIGTKIVRAGGAVCMPDAVPVDCVAWGNFSNPAALPGAVGTNAAPGGIPGVDTSSSTLVRDASPNCPTFLDPPDDTDDSLADFDVIDAESPHANADPVAGVACDDDAPQTTITKKPKRKTTKKKAKFRFESSEAGSTFQCKLDKGAYEDCSSPLKARVGLGRHKLKVAAIDAAGNRDSSPAKAKFKRVKR